MRHVVIPTIPSAACKTATPELKHVLLTTCVNVWIMVSSGCLPSVDLSRKEKKRKDYPFAVNLMRSQVLYRGAQELI